MLSTLLASCVSSPPAKKALPATGSSVKRAKSPKDKGILTRQEIDAAVSKGKEDIRLCFSSSGLKKASFNLEFRVLETGRVVDISVKSNSNLETMKSCTRQVVANWIFPKPSGGSVKISIPFSFASEADAVSEERKEFVLRSLEQKKEFDAEKISACYQKALSRRPELEGGFSLTLVLERDGSQRSCELTEDTLNDEKVSRCVSRLVSSWRFPSLDGDELTVTVPFSFFRNGTDENPENSSTRETGS